MEQLDYVEKYFVKTKSWNWPKDYKLTGPDLYALTFLPGLAKNDNLTVKGEKFYNWNPLADKDKDGKITKDDLWKTLQGKYVDDASFT